MFDLGFKAYRPGSRVQAQNQRRSRGRRAEGSRPGPLQGIFWGLGCRVVRVMCKGTRGSVQVLEGFYQGIVYSNNYISRTSHLPNGRIDDVSTPFGGVVEPGRVYNELRKLEYRLTAETLHPKPQNRLKKPDSYRQYRYGRRSGRP